MNKLHNLVDMALSQGGKMHIHFIDNDSLEEAKMKTYTFADALDLTVDVKTSGKRIVEHYWKAHNNDYSIEITSYYTEVKKGRLA
jgi:hypothetical protein